TNVLINFSTYFADGSNVRYKLDDGSIQTIWMDEAAGGEALGIFNGSRAIPWIKGLLDHDTLVVSFDSYSRRGLEFSFDVSGLRNHLSPRSEACDWSF